MYPAVLVLSLLPAVQAEDRQDPLETVREAVLALAREPGFGLQEAATADGRFRIFTDQAALDADQAFGASVAVLQRFENAFGPVDSKQDEPLLGFVLGNMGRYQSLCARLEEADPDNAPFHHRSRITSGFLLYRPLVGAALRRGEDAQEQALHSFLHILGHLEVFRRWGMLPFWLREGLACAAEEGLDGVVAANWFRTGTVLDLGERDWRGPATRDIVLTGKPGLEELFAYSARPFEDKRARLAFAFVTYGIEGAPKEFNRFCQRLASLRTSTWKGGTFFEPPPERVAQLVRLAFGEDPAAGMRAWWEIRQPPAVFAARIREELSRLRRDVNPGLRELPAPRNRFHLLTDQGMARARKAAQLAAGALDSLDHAFGTLRNPETDAWLVVAVADPGLHARLCEAMARADPLHAKAFLAGKDGPGLVLPAVRVATMLLTESGEGLLIDHCIAHSLVHLECERRFGALPGWLVEGLACAAEDEFSGQVLAACHRPGATPKGLAARWRGSATRKILDSDDFDLERLYRWDPAFWDEDLARAAYAFAAYGLERQPAALQGFCLSLSASHLRLAAMSAAHARAGVVSRLAADAFGSRLEEQLRKYWKHPLNWRKVAKNLQGP